MQAFIYNGFSGHLCAKNSALTIYSFSFFVDDLFLNPECFLDDAQRPNLLVTTNMALVRVWEDMQFALFFSKIGFSVLF